MAVMASRIEDLLSVIGEEKHGAARNTAQPFDDGGYDVIGVKNAVVIGVDIFFRFCRKPAFFLNIVTFGEAFKRFRIT